MEDALAGLEPGMSEAEQIAVLVDAGVELTNAVEIVGLLNGGIAEGGDLVQVD